MIGWKGVAFIKSEVQIHTEYQIRLSDYRKAVYCALMIRYRRWFLCMAVVLGLAFVYVVGLLSGLFPLFYPAIFVAVAELIWGLIRFAKAERGIYEYVRDPNSYIGTTFTVEFEELRICVQTDRDTAKRSIPWTRVYCVLEYDSFYAVYFTPQETCIVPRRAFSDGDDALLSKLLSEQLGERYMPAKFRVGAPMGRRIKKHL